MKSSKIVIVAQSEMAGGFVPTAHGSFASIKDAEIHGKLKIKSIKWRVANEISRVSSSGETEVSHEYVSSVFDPRYSLED